MGANVQPIFTAVPHISGVTFANADGTTEKTLFTPGANGSRIDSIVICSNDSSNQSVAFWINDGSTDHYIGTVAVPMGSGYTTVARVEAITTLAPTSVGGLVLPSGYALKCAMVSAVTTSDLVSVVALGGDY